MFAPQGSEALVLEEQAGGIGVPPTPAEFDYDLWTTEDGRCMVRVKRTGEVSEVEREVFRLLRAEEKRMRREKKGVPIPGRKDAYAPLLSLNYVSSKGTEWIEETGSMESDLMLTMTKAEFVRSLTPNQAEIYRKCILGGLSYAKYAEQKGVSYQSVQNTIERIRAKAKKIFF